jgi:hypothetical protein
MGGKCRGGFAKFVDKTGIDEQEEKLERRKEREIQTFPTESLDSLQKNMRCRLGEYK